MDGGRLQETAGRSGNRNSDDDVKRIRSKVDDFSLACIGVQALGHSPLSLGRSETLEFVTGQFRQSATLLGEEMDAFSHF